MAREARVSSEGALACELNLAWRSKARAGRGWRQGRTRQLETWWGAKQVRLQATQCQASRSLDCCGYARLRGGISCAHMQ
mmetsp:Transcript_30803/g.61828  ORF Transcript_30803/g.61828 Transcript_30803/m.61828 type:complete len:80 (-) Transcript_30803:169-408(-)